MRSLVRYVSVGALALCVLASCTKKPTYESVKAEMLETAEAMRKELATVKDKATAEAAKPRLEKLSVRMEEIQKSAKTLEGPSPENFDDSISAPFGALMSELMRVQMIPEAAGVLDSIKIGE
jgi:hypothetical protein